MRATRNVLLGIIVLGLASSAAQAATATGTVSNGSDNQGFAVGFANEWNDSSDFICSNTGTGVFRITAKTGPCAGRTASIRFAVNSGGTSNTTHSFVYDVNCTSTRITHTLGFDGGTPVPINNTFAVFDLTPALAAQGTGDQVAVTSAEGTVPKPALGFVGMVSAAVLMGLALLFAVRRRRHNPVGC